MEVSALEYGRHNKVPSALSIHSNHLMQDSDARNWGILVVRDKHFVFFAQSNEY